jgi:hypothetical protein
MRLMRKKRTLKRKLTVAMRLTREKRNLLKCRKKKKRNLLKCQPETMRRSEVYHILTIGS